MKRYLPLLSTLLAVVALSASIAYWAMELYKPEQRKLAAAPPATVPDPSPDAGATLMGGQAVAVAVSNYQLTGVISSGAQGVAILVADGQPPKAVQVGKEISTGVIVKEVHPRYVTLSEGGILKRIDLAADDKAAASMGLAPPAADQYQQAPPPPQPMPVPAPAPVQAENVPQPANGPMEVPTEVNGSQQPAQALPPGVPPPPPPQPSMPRPTRNFSNSGGPPPTQ